MNNNQRQSGNKRRYDTAFINPCIDRVLEATEQVQNGLNVLLVFENQLNRGDSFQVTQSLPLNIFALPKLFGQLKLRKKIFLLCPHLIQPQKVIYSNFNKAKIIAKIADTILKNQFNTKADFINRDTPDNLSFLKINTIRGVVFQEYKINITRLFIEILKYYEGIGGKILMKNSIYPNDIKTIIQCQSRNKQSYLLPIKVPSNFVLVYKSKKYILRFTENQKRLQIEAINKSSTQLSIQELGKISKEFIVYEKGFVPDTVPTSFVSIKTIKNIIRLIKSPFPGTIENTTIKDNYELGLEKFDIAKQTGITYPEFKIIFQRYGAGIDELIDEAYEKMNKIRDPKKIWETAENDYQIKYEWKVS